MSNKYEVNKELVLSTGHISASTGNMLECNNLPPRATNLVVQVTKYNWRILTTDDGLEDLEGVPEDLIPLLRLANNWGCKWLLLDQDGPVIDDLKVF